MTTDAPPRLTLATLYPLAAALGIGAGVTVLVVTVFNYLVGPMSADLGLSRTAIAGALSLHLSSLVVALPVAGYLADRIGAQRLIIASAIAYGAALFAISRATGDMTLLYSLFLLAGFAGAGVSPIVYARVIVHRFDRHRGLALGIALAGGGLAQIILPQIVRPIVLAEGWRAGFVAIAIIAAAIGLMVGLVSRETRESSTPGAKKSAEGFTLRQALSTPTFWIMTAAFSLLGVVISGTTSHLTEIWTALGLDPDTVPAFQATVGAATIGGRLLGGFAMDRMPARFVGMAAAWLGACGLLMLGSGMATGLLLVGAGIGIGLCTGAESDVVSYLSSRFFGLANFGRIYALQGSFFLIGFSLGPVTASLASQSIGFGTLLWVGAGCLVVSGMILGLVRAPRSPDAVSS